MFDYTRSVINDTISSLKKIAYGLDIFFQTFYIIYLAFSLFFKSGILVAKVLLLLISISYFVFFIVTKNMWQSKEDKAKKKKVKFFSKWSKKLVNLIVIIISVVQLCLDAENADMITVILLIFMSLGFVITLIFDLVLEIINARIQLLFLAAEIDRDIIAKPFVAPVNAVKKIFGKEPEEKQYDKKKLAHLDELLKKSKK